MKRVLVVSTVVAAAAGMALLLRFPPAEYSFYPTCPVWTYLHLKCPGCGTTRALAALLRGDLREALRSNALFVALLPLLLGYGGLAGYRAWTAETFRWPEISRRAVYAVLGMAALFGVVRNLPI